MLWNIYEIIILVGLLIPQSYIKDDKQSDHFLFFQNWSIHFLFLVVTGWLGFLIDQPLFDYFIAGIILIFGIRSIGNCIKSWLHNVSNKEYITRFDFCIFLILIIYFLYNSLDRIDHGFTAYDSIVSWNSWAQSWAQGVIPSATYKYSQGLPLISSLIYRVSFDVNFLLIVYNFWLLLPVVFSLGLSTSFRTRRSVLLSVFIFWFMFGRFHWDFVGYADIFITITALIAVCSLMTIIQQRASTLVGDLYLLAPGLFVAVNSKQFGLVVGFVGLFVIAYRHWKSFSFSNVVLFYIVIFSMYLFYIFQLGEVFAGARGDETIKHFTLTASRSPVERFWIPFSMHLSGLLVLAPLVFGMVSRNISRKLVAAGLVYYFVWVFGLSYDFRNLLPVTTLSSFLMGYTMNGICEKFLLKIKGCQRLAGCGKRVALSWVVLSMAVGSASVGGTIVARDAEEKNLFARTNFLEPAVVEALSYFIDQRRDEVLLVTQRSFVSRFPGMSSEWIIPVEFSESEQLEHFRRAIVSHDSWVALTFEGHGHFDVSPAFQTELNKLIAERTIKYVTLDSGVRFYFPPARTEIFK